MNNESSQSILITGVAGFIGSYFGSKHINYYSNKFILITLYIILFIMGILMVFREFV